MTDITRRTNNFHKLGEKAHKSVSLSQRLAKAVNLSTISYIVLIMYETVHNCQRFFMLGVRREACESG